MVLREIEADLAQSKPMARLVQGDVGSGKTVVAIAALLSTIASGWQGALMAPTEVLAEQHHRNLCHWFPQLHITVELLTGSTPRPRRRQLLDDLASGSLKLLVGTHALLEDPVVFERLGLVVVDERQSDVAHQPPQVPSVQTPRDPPKERGCPPIISTSHWPGRRGADAAADGALSP